MKYYAATDGKRTTFRATAERTYASAGFDPIRFSASPPKPGMYATREITKSEYDALQARKVERIKSAGRDPDLCNSPQFSWI